MIRIVCPHCHTPLSLAELETVEIDHTASLRCPECALVLLSDAEEPASEPVHAPERMRIAACWPGQKT